MIKKILYIEDELDAEVISEIFKSVLSEEEIAALEQSENDDEAILQAVNTNKRLEITSSFTAALCKLNDYYNDYDLLIVDRNLYGSGAKYKRSEIPDNLQPKYGDDFTLREGDFLLHLMIRKGYDIDNKFFILTGNEDPIIVRDEFKFILTERFMRNNIILKESDGIEKVRIILESMITRLNAVYFDILRTYIPDHGDSMKRLFHILEDSDKENRISDNLSRIRIIYEKIIAEFFKKFPDMKTICFDTAGKKKGNWLQILEKKQFINVIQRNFFQAIFYICSRFGSHPPDQSVQIYRPSLDTAHALVSALKDIILWFGAVCEKHSNKE